MPSKRCYFHPDCKSFVFGLPRDTGLREQWLKFIFNSVPDHYNPNLAVCATHFTQGSFQNVNEFKAGFARRLLLKDGAVPTLKDEAAVFGPQPYSPKVRLCAEHFTKDSFLNLGEYNAGYTQRLLLKNGAVPTLVGQSGASESKRQKSAMIDLQYSLQYSLMAPRRSTKNGVEDSTGSSDEDMDICDRDSVASSVDSTAEEMFMDGLDSILDQPSPDLYPPEEDCDSEASQQQRKRFRLSSPSSAADGGGRESGNYNLSGVSSERWHNSDEADVEPLQLDFSPVQEPGPKFLPIMSSSSGPLTEELQCSICLNVFTDPVSTPCGHNFCRTCLNKHWDDNQTCNCPYCKETFKQRLDIKMNTTLQELVDHYKKSPEKKPEVLCDICEERKLKALKSCLVCQSSYCESHLERHLREAALKKHKLINPTSNLEDYICQKHERPLELFCRDDQTMVCLSCTDGDHKNHITVFLEEESEAKKTQLMKTQKDVQQMIQDRINKIQEVKHSAEVRKRNTEKEKAAHVELFTGLIRSTERCQTELLEMMEEQQKAAEKQEEELIEDLEQEITELKMRNTELEQLSNTEDHLQVLQIYSSLSSSRNTRNLSEISMKTDECLETRRRALTQLKDTLQEKHTQNELKWMQQYAVDVTLDPDTAHPNLILSDDGKQVECGDIWQEFPDKPERFEKYGVVLGKERFSSGRFYFEVQVKGNPEWALGVARESINRKGKLKLSPNNGCWSVILRKENEYSACASPYVSLCLKVKPQQVSVFVDYEEGLVSFYDVESCSHIYSYTGQSFTGNLYPFFSPEPNDNGKNSSPLIITPVNYNK
ncbi:E3 ubiquitin-protein ligase TRIM39-like isoform X2 [Megalobrama amblycephala]|uniref:E3 ubiquitin-protein ligase TRIM39-like isoform X2 n=1 Tax=Megalobrama amblycephala TaxID=75352 RepID=UPI0020140DFE|nr:E3 ubiquitin-protein ligase TRIM39-like isoform X2 [Megalobrama amblycephala]